MNDGDNPMSSAHKAPRCTARAKGTGQLCRGPAVTGWRVCRVHGAGGGHPPGKDHPSWKHGMRAREWIERRKRYNDQVRASIQTTKLILSPKKS